ncbi:MAG: PHP domain-containing protein, partial [Anaerovoracaceae bacterium]
MEKLLDRYKKDNYQYQLTKASLSKETGKLTLEIGLNFIIPFEETEKLKGEILAALPELNHVALIFSYQDLVMAREEAIMTFLGHMIAKTACDCKGLTKGISSKQMEVTQEEIHFYVLGKAVAALLNEKAAKKFELLLKEELSLNYRVCFFNNEEVYEQTMQDVEESMKKMPTPQQVYAPAAPKGSQPAKGNKGGAKSAKEGPITGNVFLGKAIRSQGIPLSEMREAGTKVVVEGEVFKLEDRTIKSGKKLVTFLFSDGTTSACAKFFATEEKWQPISEVLKTGVYVRVRGDVEWDSYSNSLVLMAKDIEKAEKAKREDKAERKRIELHAHTKMSALDGLNDTETMVKQAIAWGHSAIAITDHGVVQSFPTAANVAKDKIKIIYGVEGYLFDDSDCTLPDGTIEYKKKNTNHVIILARTQEGLKNLYKLVSLSHLEYFYKRPRIPKSILTKYREGLIVGSACEAGEVFRGITGGASEEELSRLVDFYDYLEVQPLANNQFMINKGMAGGEEDLKA